MIFGNPFILAVQIDHMPQWGDSYLNGIFLIYINGLIINPEVRCETLDIQAGFLSAALLTRSYPRKHFAELPETSLNYDDDQLYIFLNRLTFPKNIDIDQCLDYIVSVDALLDCSIELYAFNKEGVDYLFVAHTDKGFIQKIAIDVSECCRIAQSAEAYTTHLLAQQPAESKGPTLNGTVR